MRTLILGCGYVGLELGRQLRATGREVIGVRRDPAGLAALEVAGIHPHIGDLTTPLGWASLPDSVDEVVFCMAARARDLASYRRVYREGIERLVAWAQGRPLHRVVYTGSTGVYAQRDGSDVDETSATEPEEPTGRVLLEAETCLREAARSGLIPGVALRVAGIYGPDRGYWLQRGLRGELRLEGDGSRWINMIHRDDLVQAILAALDRGVPGEVYNVVDDEPVRQRDLFAWLGYRLGVRILPSEERSALEGNENRSTASSGAASRATRPAGGKGRAVHRRIRNDRIRRELGSDLRFPTFREGFEAELNRLGY